MDLELRFLVFTANKKQVIDIHLVVIEQINKTGKIADRKEHERLKCETTISIVWLV